MIPSFLANALGIENILALNELNDVLFFPSKLRPNHRVPGTLHCLDFVGKLIL